MADPVLLGYVRELVRGPSIDDQLALLAGAGVLCFGWDDSRFHR